GISARRRKGVRGGGLAQQWRRFEDRPAGNLAPVIHALDDRRDAPQGRPEHRPALADREAVAIGPYDVDVGGAQGNALGEDLRALVDQRQVHALDDLLGRNVATGDTEVAGRPFDEVEHFRIRV